MLNDGAVNLIFGGHSPLGMEISRSLSTRGRTIHVSRSIDSNLTDYFQGLSTEFLAWESLTYDSIKAKQEILKSFKLKNLIFSLRNNSVEKTSILDFLNIDVIFPSELIDFFIEHELFEPQSNIIFVSSPAANRVLDDQPLGYHISKAGLNQLVRYLANSMGPNTKVNAIAPGSFVIKPRNRDFFDSNSTYTTAIQNFVPTGIIPEVEFLVSVIHFLISSENKVIDGQIIDLSGGYLNLEPSHVFRKSLNL